MDEISPPVRVDGLEATLRPLVAGSPNPVELQKLSLAVPSEGKAIVLPDRRDITLYDGKNFIHWRVESLRALFRGDRQPPQDMREYPAQCFPFFHGVDRHVMALSDTEGMNLPDTEFVEIFSAMRRRPDGRRLNTMHDVVWQAAAVCLGLTPWSEAEYNAIFLRLEHSARTFNLGQSSRNYLKYLRGQIAKA